MTPDPKPARRIVDPAACRAKVLLEGCCRICGLTVGLTFHHIVPRSQGGDDVAANGVPLHGSGTTGCHGKVEARDPLFRSLLRSRLTSDEEAYVARKKSMAWLDIHYPLEAAA